jgi:hypothetical protein
MKPVVEFALNLTAAPMALCKKCGRTIQFFESQCECGVFDSFPNVRAAKEEIGQLAAR